jgi:hypothetical protein
MPVRKSADVTLSKAGDWLDWHDALLDLAQEHELGDLVDLEKKQPVSEILLPKPEKPNPLALFPKLLDEIPPAARKQVEIPLHNDHGDGVAVNPRHTLVRNQAIEDDALVHLTSTQAAGWRTRLAAYNFREKEWRSQRRHVFILRRWIDKHIDPVFVHRIRQVEGVREALEVLRRMFSAPLEQYLAHQEYGKILKEAGHEEAGDAKEWFRKWRIAYDRASRLGALQGPGTSYDANQFLMAVKCYEPKWVSGRMFGVGDRELSLRDLADSFHTLLEYAPDTLEGTAGPGAGHEDGLYECPCRSAMVSHKPEECWYVKAAVQGQTPKRLNKKWLNKTRDALTEPRWDWLVKAGSNTS